MDEQIAPKTTEGYIRIGDLRVDTTVYVSKSATPDGDKLFQIVHWKDKEHTDSTQMTLSSRELEKLHRLVKQWRKHDGSSQHDSGN